MSVTPRVKEGAIAVKPPTEGNVTRFATATGSNRYNIPASWRGHWVTFTAVTTAIQIVFGDSSVSITADQASSVSTEDITNNDASGFTVAAGSYHSWYIENTTGQNSFTDFAVTAADALGFWEACVSDWAVDVP